MSEEHESLIKTPGQLIGAIAAGPGFVQPAGRVRTMHHDEFDPNAIDVEDQRGSGGARRGLELWALSVAVLMSGALAWYSWRLVWQSNTFHDISTAADATPLWMPQVLMGLGCTVLFIALLDDWVLEWRGQRSRAEGDTRHE